MTREEASASARTAVPTFAMWAWLIPSAYFWHRADADGFLLPHLPSIVWMPAGALWEHAPLVFLAVVALLPLGIHALRTRTPAYRLLRRAALGVGGVGVVVHVLWGTAMVRAGGA